MSLVSPSAFNEPAFLLHSIDPTDSSLLQKKPSKPIRTVDIALNWTYTYTIGPISLKRGSLFMILFM